jgi:hypothetical protein
MLGGTIRKKSKSKLHHKNVTFKRRRYINK